MILFWLPLIGLILAIVSIVLFVSHKKKGGDSGLAIAGLVMAIICIFLQIFVVAVAVGVLVQTAASLESKALDVGRQSQEKITTELEVIQVYAEGAEDMVVNAGEDEIRIATRIGAGSQPIKFEDLLVQFDTAESSQTLENGVLASTKNYEVNYLVQGSNYIEGYLNSGDMVQLSLISDSDLDVSDSGVIRLIAKSGAVKPIDITIPSRVTDDGTFLLYS
ncbi:MAG: hypothetical protein ACOCXG_01965 [Nanoarchaeota archaeon]